ncbi:ATP-binding protein [Streptomyces griseosporeus]|uniref:ATP-binding protein n=1 Tax=Streptomyces griseosporeus TaxID=1910 RepID=UPI0037B97F6D
MTEDDLVGRGRELAVLERQLDDARDGRGGLVLVEGEAGAGKTALAHALARRARRRGARVAWGACLEGEGTAPYRPWVQILADLRPGPATADLTAPAPDDRSRYQVFDAVTQTLRTAAGPAALLVVLDDLHWADAASLRLLQWTASALADDKVLLVGLYRGREPFSYSEAEAVLRAVGRERAARTLALGALAPDEVAVLAERALGRTPEEDLLDVVRERCEGNPLFVLEMLRLAQDAPRMPGRAVLPGRLPATVREAVGRRLGRLDPDVRLTLRQASVLGREFTLPLLAALTAGTPDALLDHLDAAVAAELVTDLDGHTFRFAHVLTQEVLAAELPSTARRRLHARAATALAAAPGGSPDAVAHHLRQAAPLTGGADALAATRAAADRASAQLAHEHAAFQFRQALGLLPLVDGGEAQRPELLLELARCAFRSGAVDEAWRACKEAADLGRAAGDARVVADAATVVRGITNSPLTAELHALSEDALTLLGDGDPVRRARLLAQSAATLDPFASARAPETSHRALLAAEACGDPDALFLALQARHTALVDGRHVLERLAIGERALRLGRDTGRAEPTAWGHAWRMDAFWELGRRVQLDAELAAFSDLVARMKEPLWQWRLLRVRACLALYEGRFDDARDLAERALAIGRRGGHEGAAFLDLVFRSHLAVLSGRGFPEVEARVRAFVAEGPFLAAGWLADVLVAQGRTAEAAGLWRTIAPAVRDFPRHAPEWIVAQTTSAHLAVRFDDRATAALLHDELLPYADRHVTAAAHNPSGGPVTLCLGVLAGYLGDRPAAERHLHAALASCRATGSPPYEAWTHFETALVLSRRRPPDPRGAAEHLAAARALAERLGMRPLLDRIAAAEPAGRTSVLTPREEEVAALVKDGLSNRQIARRLHMAERTAENHVTHILTKLGFDSRARIAAWYASRDRDRG